MSSAAIVTSTYRATSNTLSLFNNILKQFNPFISHYYHKRFLSVSDDHVSGRRQMVASRASHLYIADHQTNSIVGQKTDGQNRIMI